MNLADERGGRLMVLGAAGFIGRWVARELASRGATLDLVGRDAAATRDILGRWAARGTILTANLADAGQVRALVADRQPAVIINLAGYGVDPSERDAALAARLNTELPETLAIALGAQPRPAHTGIRLIHAGSALEYGIASGDLDEATAGAPTTLYGQTKLAGTERLLAASRTHAVPVIVARLFTVYGPGELPGRLLPTLLAAARAPGPIPLTAGGQQRDFTYVEDVARTLADLGALPAREPMVNVATGRLTTVRSFVETAAGVLGIARERLQFGAVPTRPEEMRHRPVTVARLRRLTGGAPSTTIGDGVARSAAWRDAS